MKWSLLLLLVACVPIQYSNTELWSIGSCACSKFDLGKLKSINSFRGRHLFVCELESVSLSYRVLQNTCGSKENPGE